MGMNRLVEGVCTQLKNVYMTELSCIVVIHLMVHVFSNLSTKKVSAAFDNIICKLSLFFTEIMKENV